VHSNSSSLNHTVPRLMCVDVYFLFADFSEEVIHVVNSLVISA